MHNVADFEDRTVKSSIVVIKFFCHGNSLTPHQSVFNIVWLQKISILPPQKGLEIPGRRGLSKSEKFKAMYEAKLEFPEGWGVMGQIPSMGGGRYRVFKSNRRPTQVTGYFER